MLIYFSDILLCVIYCFYITTSKICMKSNVQACAYRVRFFYRYLPVSFVVLLSMFSVSFYPSRVSSWYLDFHYPGKAGPG